MAIIACPECGKNISDNAFSCPNCGYPLNNTTYTQRKKIIPGRGFGISAMIMGILGAVYSFVSFTSAITTPEYILTDEPQIIVLSIIFAVLALVFGLVSHSKGYHKGQKDAGIILGIISLVLCIITVVINAYYVMSA